MSFGLARGRTFDTTGVELDAKGLPSLPDDILTDRTKGYLDVGAWFAEPKRPLHIEIGSGKGTFLLQEAPNWPEVNWLGMEYEGEFFKYAADRVRRAGLPNVKMMCIDASEFVHWRVASDSVDVIHLYFPDPWPKSKHHRRRMIQDRFLQDCARVLKMREGIHGELRVVTDHPEYWAWMEEHFARFATKEGEGVEKMKEGMLFTREAFKPPAGAGEGELVGTNFERKYRREGRPFHAAVLRVQRRL
jgi:tRNA (guanine-N7-)-methyltransferase